MLKGSKLSDTFFLISSQTIDSQSTRISKRFHKTSRYWHYNDNLSQSTLRDSTRDISLSSDNQEWHRSLDANCQVCNPNSDTETKSLTQTGSPANARLDFHLSILRACKSIHCEANDVLLHDNRFVYQTQDNLWYCKQYSLFHLYFTARYSPLYEHLFNDKEPILLYLNRIQHLTFRIGGLGDSTNVRQILRHLSAANLTLKTLSIETWDAWHPIWIQRMLKALERVTVSRHITISANEREFTIGYERIEAFWNINIGQFEEEMALWDGNGYYTVVLGELKTSVEPLDESGNGDVHTMREWVLTPCEEFLSGSLPALMAECAEPVL